MRTTAAVPSESRSDADAWTMNVSDVMADAINVRTRSRLSTSGILTAPMNHRELGSKESAPHRAGGRSGLFREIVASVFSHGFDIRYRCAAWLIGFDHRNSPREKELGPQDKRTLWRCAESGRTGLDCRRLTAAQVIQAESERGRISTRSFAVHRSGTQQRPTAFVRPRQESSRWLRPLGRELGRE